MNKVLTNYYEMRSVHDMALGLLDKEVTRIIKVITKVFKCKKYWWSYKYYDSSDDDPPLPDDITKSSPKGEGDSLPIHISECCDSGDWYYNEDIPVKFFDMTDQEIEDYIKKEIVDCKAKEEHENLIKNQKKEINLAKKKVLMESALKKLTKEERKSLSIYCGKIK